MLLGFGMQSNFAMSYEDKLEMGNASIEFTRTEGNTSESLLFKYNDLDDLETFNYGVLTEVFSANADDCEVTATVTVTASFSIGGDVVVARSAQQSTISISAQVTASCGEIEGAVKSLIAKLRKAVGL